MIELREHAEGLIVPVRAQPGARKTGITGERNGTLKLAVNAPADAGRANAALVDLLCEQLGLRRSQIELMKGDKSRDKLFLIRGVSQGELQRRLEALVGESHRIESSFARKAKRGQ